MRETVSTLLEVAGMAVVVVGVGMLSVPVGVITAGACLFAVGFMAVDQ